MASYQRIALFILFDSIEQDLVQMVRHYARDDFSLSDEETQKARKNLKARIESRLDYDDPYDQLYGLDLGEKYQVLMRHKAAMEASSKSYYSELQGSLMGVISIRNSVMHGRPLTINEYSIGFAFAQSLLASKSRWPALATTYLQYSRSPETLVSRSVQFFDEGLDESALSNLPAPDYDDTGFLPRPKLERELKKKILGRHPVVTVLGDGGNGKTALALQTLYGLLDSQDHQFDAILWFSAKTSMLGPRGIEQIEGAVSGAIDIVSQAADFQSGNDKPMERLRMLLKENRVLLAVDNLETVTGSELRDIAEDVPGDSKILFTSRVPVGGDLTVNVGEFEDGEAVTYLRSLVRAYGVRELRGLDNEALGKLAKRLGNKPLLLKWLVLGVKSGLDPTQITADPKVALKFCLENVMTRLGKEARAVVVILATLPVPGSTTLIAHVGNMRASAAEDGLSELARFGLIESVRAEGSERLFKLRPFARSYVMRIVSPSPQITDAIRSRYTKLEYDLQSERSRGLYNPYEARNYIIRSASEFVVSEKLRQATRAASYADMERAEQILSDTRLSDPGYFEVYRAEAFIAMQANDVFRAISAYESALEFGDEQPQLHFFFGGLLMRAGYLDRAAAEFDRALELDQSSSAVYREAARNEFFRHRFAKARELLSLAADHSQKSHKDRIILADLQIQSYTRELDFHLKTGNRSDIPGVIDGLRTTLEQIDRSLIDQTTSDHLISVLPNLSGAEALKVHETASSILFIRKWIEDNVTNRLRSKGEQAKGQDVPRIGVLKESGRQPTYGFIVDEVTKEGFFLHRKTVTPEVWQALLLGEQVSFDIFVRKDGRTQASNVNLRRK